MGRVSAGALRDLAATRTGTVCPFGENRRQKPSGRDSLLFVSGSRGGVWRAGKRFGIGYGHALFLSELRRTPRAVSGTSSLDDEKFVADTGQSFLRGRLSGESFCLPVPGKTHSTLGYPCHEYGSRRRCTVQLYADAADPLPLSRHSGSGDPPLFAQTVCHQGLSGRKRKKEEGRGAPRRGAFRQQVQRRSLLHEDRRGDGDKEASQKAPCRKSPLSFIWGSASCSSASFAALWEFADGLLGCLHCDGLPKAGLSGDLLKVL